MYVTRSEHVLYPDPLFPDVSLEPPGDVRADEPLETEPTNGQWPLPGGERVENFLAAGCSELVRQSPSDEFTIVSLSRGDPKFQTICRDFGEAITAYHSFRAEGRARKGPNR